MAEHLENLSLKEQVCLFRHLPADEAAEALAELDQEVAVDVLENLDPDEAAQIIAEMSPDDAADVLDELEEGHRDVLLSNLDRDDAEELRNLLAFDPDTAGGIMNTEIILLEQDITVDEAISLIRRGMEEDMEIPYYAYVVDEDDKLVGVFSLRDLMLSKPGTILRDSLHDQDVIAVRYDTSSEEVARRMSHYNFMAMPVVDYEGRLLGVATYDDILDIMQDEASADLLGMVGAGQDETVDTPWLESVQIRLPWLIVNMVTSMMSAFVVYMFEGSIAGMALLAVLMPMVANQAGNTGQQALAVMIRQLATEKFDRKRAWIAVLREGKIGIASGVIMAMLACVGVWFTSSSPELGMVMGAALMGDIFARRAGGQRHPPDLPCRGPRPRAGFQHLPHRHHRQRRLLLFFGGWLPLFCCRKCGNVGKGGRPFLQKGPPPFPPHPSTPKTSIFIESLLTVYPDDGETALDGESEKAKRTGLCQAGPFLCKNVIRCFQV